MQTGLIKKRKNNTVYVVWQSPVGNALFYFIFQSNGSSLIFIYQIIQLFQTFHTSQLWLMNQSITYFLISLLDPSTPLFS